jgi:hypothetical protein
MFNFANSDVEGVAQPTKDKVHDMTMIEKKTE